MRAGRASVLLFFLLTAPAMAAAQSTGALVGRVTERDTGLPVAGADVRIVDLPLRMVTNAEGRFLFVAVPAGERSVRVELIGFRPVILERVPVRAGRTAEVAVALERVPVDIGNVVVTAERIRLIEPDVSTTHEVVSGRELRALPMDRIADAIELAPGVSDGHFRGGRSGQEVYVVDGIELKNQFEAATQGFGLELSPSSLHEVEVVTGGFGAAHGSALSGVVSLVTRRGSTEAWEGRASLLSDSWAPAAASSGFTGASLSAGGPLAFLGEGTTLFTDLLLQGMADAEPRARGLTCLEPGDASDEVAALIRSVDARLRCPWTSADLPHQRGDKLIAFGRLDRPLAERAGLTVSLLRNRNQRELYTPEFKYNATGQLGQRFTGTLGTLQLDVTRPGTERALHLAARLGLMRLERHLGALDPWTFTERTRVAGFGVQPFRFHGEAFVHRPIEEQLAAATAVPGYDAPATGPGTPFGGAAEGLFFTTGTPHIANWTRTEMAGLDLLAEVLDQGGSALRAGGAGKFYRVESYERVQAHLGGSSPSYARFFPATVSGFLEGSLLTEDHFTILLGLRAEAFRSGLGFAEDRTDFLSPVIDTEWQINLMPRVGVALPVPGTEERATLRFNFGRVAQPPDFRYFLDTSIGDSLRTDVRRQGNPALSFERGNAYEVGAGYLLSPNMSLGITVFNKTLENLVSGSFALAGSPEATFVTGDYGTVRGAEFSLRARWPGLTARAGYALQKATGVGSGTETDSLIDPDDRVTYPLAFDRRHAVDLALFAGAAAGGDQPWAAALTGSVQSGYPLDRLAAAREEVAVGDSYLPWTAVFDLRASRELGSLPGCGGCAWRVSADVRNLLGADNIQALRRDSGHLAPSAATIRALETSVPLSGEPIPRESPLYSSRVDLDGDGMVSLEELRQGRLAAVLDRLDPSIFFGEERQLRLGVEVSFR
ncbi:MAG: TonB-dependent receptor [Gemmatimonadota bacterium]